MAVGVQKGAAAAGLPAGERREGVAWRPPEALPEVRALSCGPGRAQVFNWRRFDAQITRTVYFCLWNSGSPLQLQRLSSFAAFEAPPKRPNNNNNDNQANNGTELSRIEERLWPGLASTCTARASKRPFGTGPKWRPLATLGSSFAIGHWPFAYSDAERARGN